MNKVPTIPELYGDIELLPPDIFPSNLVIGEQVLVLLTGIDKLSQAKTEIQQQLWVLRRILQDYRNQKETFFQRTQGSIAYLRALINNGLIKVQRQGGGEDTFHIIEPYVNLGEVENAVNSWNFNNVQQIPPALFTFDAGYIAADADIIGSQLAEVSDAYICAEPSGPFSVTTQTAIDQLYARTGNASSPTELTFPTIIENVNRLLETYEQQFNVQEGPNRSLFYVFKRMWYLVMCSQFGKAATDCYIKKVVIWISTAPNYRPAVPGVEIKCATIKTTPRKNNKPPKKHRPRKRSPSPKKH
uniref:PreC/core protein n=1 Tax=Fish-associated hepatitis B virus TaxID=3003970 RepID=A0A9E9JNA1_HBV|nr:MAG: preC/core protein [Fish-associated hepatitis B virus]